MSQSATLDSVIDANPRELRTNRKVEPTGQNLFHAAIYTSESEQQTAVRPGDCL